MIKYNSDMHNLTVYTGTWHVGSSSSGMIIHSVHQEYCVQFMQQYFTEQYACHTYQDTCTCPRYTNSSANVSNQ